MKNLLKLVRIQRLATQAIEAIAEEERGETPRLEAIVLNALSRIRAILESH